jgi:hypothetical protein
VLGHRRDVTIEVGLLVGDVAAGGDRDLLDGLGERQQSRTGHLVLAAAVPTLGQRGHRHVGDVVGVDERLVPVERGRAGPGPAPHRHTACLEAVRDPPARLAIRTQYQSFHNSSTCFAPVQYVQVSQQIAGESMTI